MEAGAAQLVLFDERDLEVEFGRAQCARVSTAASTKDHKVECGAGVVRHGILRADDRKRTDDLVDTTGQSGHRHLSTPGA